MEKIEDLESSLGMPSFEEELAASDITKQNPEEPVAFTRICPKCGHQYLVVPKSSPRCPCMHDPEDDTVAIEDSPKLRYEYHVQRPVEMEF